MTFDSANLHLNPVAPGRNSYMYDAGSDSMATVIASGYFNNTDDALNLTAEDKIYCMCVDGNMWLKVSSISSGVVTTQFAGGNLPINTPATGTSAENATLAVGFTEIGTSISTATRFVLPTPYAGAEIVVRRVDSGTQAIEFDAGGSGATGVVYDASNNRRITTRFEGEWFRLVGSSATRWRVMGQHYVSSGSEDLGGGASVAISGT